MIDERAIFTAGHCVFDKRSWATNVVFAPRYADGPVLGLWAMRQAAVLSGWQNQRPFKFDMAAIVLTRSIRPTTGALGRAANKPSNQGAYLELGYPAIPTASYYFDGKFMCQSAGRYLGRTSIITAGGNRTEDCSGGPWIVSNDGTAGVNGLNSNRPVNNGDLIRSPYFGESFLKLVKWIKDNGGGA